MNQGTGAAVRVRDLQVRYPGSRLPALRDLDLDLEPGASLAVVGESGSGKSVLVRALLGLAPVTRGQVLVDQVDLVSARGAVLARARRRIGTVFQSPVDSLDPRWPARRTVAEALALRLGGGLDDHLEAADALLESVGIGPERFRALPPNLSGGECQRVALARAVAGGPDLVLADEPTAMLDPEIGGHILDLLIELQGRHRFSMLYVTHHLHEVARLNRGLLVLCGGGPAERMAAEPRAPLHPFSRYLWSAADGPVEPVLLEEEGCPFRSGCPRRVEACVAAPGPKEIEEGWTVWCHNPEV